MRLLLIINRSLLLFFIFLHSKLKIDAETTFNYILDPRKKIRVDFEGDDSSLDFLNISEPVYNNLSPVSKTDKLSETLDRGISVKELKKIEKILKSEAVMGGDSITTNNFINSEDIAAVKRHLRNITDSLDVNRNYHVQNYNDQIKLENYSLIRNPRCEATNIPTENLNFVKNPYKESFKVENQAQLGMNVQPNSKKLSHIINLSLLHSELNGHKDKLENKPEENSDEALNGIEYENLVPLQSDTNDNENFSMEGGLLINDDSDSDHLKNENINKNSSELSLSPGLLDLRKPTGISNEQLHRIHRTRKDHLLKRQNNAQFYFSGKNTLHLDDKKNRYNKKIISDDNNPAHQYHYLLPIINGLGIKNTPANLITLDDDSEFVRFKSNHNSLCKLAESAGTVSNFDQYDRMENLSPYNSSIRTNRSIPACPVNEENNVAFVNDPEFIRNVSLALLQKPSDKDSFRSQYPLRNKTRCLPKNEYHDFFPMWMYNLDSKSRIEEICRLDREELAKENELQKIELEKIKKFNEILQLQLQEQLLRNTNNIQPIRIQRTVIAGTDFQPFVEEITHRASIPEIGTAITVQQNMSMSKDNSSALALNEIEEDLNDGDMTVSNNNEVSKRVYKMNFSGLNYEIPENLNSDRIPSLIDEIPENVYKTNWSRLHGETAIESNDGHDLLTGYNTKLSDNDINNSYINKLNLTSSLVNDINSDADVHGDIASFISDNILKVKDPKIIKTLKKMDASLLSFPPAFDYNLQSKTNPHKIKQRHLLDRTDTQTLVKKNNTETDHIASALLKPVARRNLSNSSLGDKSIINNNSFNNLAECLGENLDNGSSLNNVSNQTMNSILNLLEPLFSESSMMLSKLRNDDDSSNTTYNEDDLIYKKKSKNTLNAENFLHSTDKGDNVGKSDIEAVVVPQKDNVIKNKSLNNKVKGYEIIKKLNDLFGNSSQKSTKYQLNSSFKNSNRHNYKNTENNTGLSNNTLDTFFAFSKMSSTIKHRSFESKNIDNDGFQDQIFMDENVYPTTQKSKKKNHVRPSSAEWKENGLNFSNLYNPFTTKKNNAMSQNFIDLSHKRLYDTNSTSNNSNCMPVNYNHGLDKGTTGKVLKVIGFIFECNNTLRPSQNENLNNPSVQSFDRENENCNKVKVTKATCDGNNNVTANLELNQPSNCKTSYTVDRITGPPYNNSNTQDLSFIQNIVTILQSLISLQNNKTKENRSQSIEIFRGKN